MFINFSFFFQSLPYALLYAQIIYVLCILRRIFFLPPRIHQLYSCISNEFSVFQRYNINCFYKKFIIKKINNRSLNTYIF